MEDALAVLEGNCVHDHQLTVEIIRTPESFLRCLDELLAELRHLYEYRGLLQGGDGLFYRRAARTVKDLAFLHHIQLLHQSWRVAAKHHVLINGFPGQLLQVFRMEELNLCLESGAASESHSAATRLLIEATDLFEHELSVFNALSSANCGAPLFKKNPPFGQRVSIEVKQAVSTFMAEWHSGLNVEKWCDEYREKVKRSDWNLRKVIYDYVTFQQ